MSSEYLPSDVGDLLTLKYNQFSLPNNTLGGFLSPFSCVENEF